MICCCQPILKELNTKPHADYKAKGFFVAALLRMTRKRRANEAKGFAKKMRGLSADGDVRIVASGV